MKQHDKYRLSEIITIKLYEKVKFTINTRKGI